MVRWCQQLDATVHHHSLQQNPIIGWKILSPYIFNAEGLKSQLQHDVNIWLVYDPGGHWSELQAHGTTSDEW